MSGSYQGLTGKLLGTAPLQYGVFTAGTGFNQPNGQSTNWLVARATTYSRQLQWRRARRAPVIPGADPATLKCR